MTIRTTLPLRALLMLGLLAAPACDDAKKDAQADAKADAKADATQAETKAAELAADGAKADAAKAEPAPAEGGAAAGAVPAAAADVPTIGVAECDEYIATMTACFTSDAIPVEERDKQKLGFDASVKGWADAVAANPEGGGAGLVGGCKAALDMAKISYPKCFESGQ